MQEFYRHGLASLDAYCRSMHKESFVHLTSEKQDEVISAMEAGNASGFEWPSGKEFFSILRTHTMEGMFADPLYGGNRDFAGWRLVGFPGAQAIFSPSDLQSKSAFNRAPIDGKGIIDGYPENRCGDCGRRRGGRNPGGGTRKSGHESDWAGARAAPEHR
jgi:gluconate 2-dehydrogenase gamma chain